MVHREKVVQIHQRTNICQWKQVSYLTIFGWGHLERGEGGEGEQKREDEKKRDRGVIYIDRKIHEREKKEREGHGKSSLPNNQPKLVS